MYSYSKMVVRYSPPLWQISVESTTASSACKLLLYRVTQYQYCLLRVCMYCIKQKIEMDYSYTTRYSSTIKE